MLENGNYIVPHLAGLPFVEKPPGFQAMIAMGRLTTKKS
jgi:4-amino-4-deoxy-L-arabinose transferase-like glycosyltransferase